MYIYRVHTHVHIRINTSRSTHIWGPHMYVYICVRIHSHIRLQCTYISQNKSVRSFGIRISIHTIHKYAYAFTYTIQNKFVGSVYLNILIQSSKRIHKVLLPSLSQTHKITDACCALAPLETSTRNEHTSTYQPEAKRKEKQEYQRLQ